MAKKEKKISINSVDKVYKEHFDNGRVVEWRGIEISVKRSLSLSEMLEFVASVVSTVYGDDYGYMPELTEFATNSNIISMYTNVSLPSNLEHRYEILNNTDLVDTVRAAVDVGQLYDMEDAIEKKLEYLCDSSAVEVKKQMETFVSSMEDLQDKTSNLFSNISPDDISRVMGAIENGGFSEEKIVEAYRKQIAADSGE